MVRQLATKILPDNNTIFSAVATTITLALDYYCHTEPARHDIVDYIDSMSCLEVIEGEEPENPPICYIMNLLWIQSDTGICVHFCWLPSHCGILKEMKEWINRQNKPLIMILTHWQASLCRFEAASQLLYSAANSNQVGRVCESLESNIRSTKQISIPNQGRGDCYYPAWMA